MNDPLDDRIVRALHGEATSTPDPAAAHAEFLLRRRRRHQRVMAGTAVTAAVVIVAGLLALTNLHNPKSTIATVGHTSTSTASDQPVAGVPGADASTSTTTSEAAQGSSASTSRGATPTTTASGPTATTRPRTTSTTAPAVGPGPPPPGTVVVTNADNGKSYTLVRGQQLWVQLQPDDYTWTEPASSNAGILPRDGGSARGDGSASATFHGSSTGTADVTAEGRSIPPPCATATPRCLMPDHVLEFTVHVTVVG